MIGSNYELIVDKALQISIAGIFGRTQTPENWCTATYVLREDNYVTYNLSGPMANYIVPHREFYLGKNSFLKAYLD